MATRVRMHLVLALGACALLGCDFRTHPRVQNPHFVLWERMQRDGASVRFDRLRVETPGLVATLRSAHVRYFLDHNGNGLPEQDELCASLEASSPVPAAALVLPAAQFPWSGELRGRVQVVVQGGGSFEALWVPM